MLIELLHDAAMQDRQRMIAENLRHVDHDGVRRGALAAWRGRRAANRRAAAAPSPRPDRPAIAAPAPAVAHN